MVLEPGSGSRSRLRLNIPVIGCGVRRGLGGAEEGGGEIYVPIVYTCRSWTMTLPSGRMGAVSHIKRAIECVSG